MANSPKHSVFPIIIGAIAIAAFCACDDDDDIINNTLDANVNASDVRDAAPDIGTAVDGPRSDALANATMDALADAGMISVNRPEGREATPALIAQLKVPAGFEVRTFAKGLGNPRMLALGPDGAMYGTSRATSEVFRLLDGNGDGDADDAGERSVIATKATDAGLEGVHGIFIKGTDIYLASVKTVFRATINQGQLQNLTKIIADLPDGGQHPNRTLAIGPDGNLYITVGSTCNACAETNSESATILRVGADGATIGNPANPNHPSKPRTDTISPRIFASGLRNTIGFDWQPSTGNLLGLDHGADGLGDDTPPEELNQITAGRAYGWPYCWGDKKVDPTPENPTKQLTKQAYCANTDSPLAMFQAHGAPLAFQFYRGGQFPSEYNGDAFVTLRGSWNRSTPTGYKVIRIHFANGVPAALPGRTSAYEDFLSGFLVDGGEAHFGRLAGLTFDATGALLIAEDFNGYIYRVSATMDSPDAGARD